MAHLLSCDGCTLMQTPAPRIDLDQGKIGKGGIEGAAAIAIDTQDGPRNGSHSDSPPSLFRHNVRTHLVGQAEGAMIEAFRDAA